MAKVTFLMMAYNTEKYIEKAVMSVLNQTESDIELYIRNNGSTDKTGEILKKISDKDSRVHIITNKVNGISDDGLVPFESGWWPCPQEKMGEYISIIDSDDWLEPNFTEVLYHDAIETSADIVMAGCNFINETTGDVVGTRVTPEFVTDTIKYLGDSFPYLYNLARPWWGKLFKKEFFIKHYDKAWLPKTPTWYLGNTKSKVDTLVMLDYLKQPHRLSVIGKTMYNYLIRTSSTYFVKKFGLWQIMNAYTLYSSAYELLRQYEIDSEKNIDFLEGVHWGYITECMTPIINNVGMSIEESYTILECVLIDDINAIYQKRKFNEIFIQLKEVLENLEKRSESEKYNIYNSFLARMSKYVDLLDADSSNPIIFIVIMSALCDPKNRTMFGIELLNLPFVTKSEGLKQSLTYQRQIKKWWTLYPNMWVDYINSIDRNEKIESLEKEMTLLFHDGNLDGALDKAICILENNPVNIKALVAVILYSKKVHDKLLYNLLSSSISNIWNDEEIDKVRKELEGDK